jgi:hypothetical protein
MENNEQFIGGYTINLPEVAKYPGILAVTKLLASQIMVNPYLVVGDWIKSLSDSDLNSLNELVDKNEYEDVILIAEMLATGEGLPSAENEKEFQERTSTLAGFLVLESLNRKGLVKVYHENMSFGDDVGDKIIVERI